MTSPTKPAAAAEQHTMPKVRMAQVGKRDVLVNDGTGGCIADVYNYGGEIVLACNAHAQLVADNTKLRAALVACVDDLQLTLRPLGMIRSATIDHAIAVLAATEHKG